MNVLESAACLAILCCSSIALRSSARHAKDDARPGLANARQVLESGGTAWRAGDSAIAAYYRIPVREPDGSGAGLILIRGASPDQVLLLRPDIYGSAGELTRWLAVQAYPAVRSGPALTLFPEPKPVRN